MKIILTGTTAVHHPLVAANLYTGAIKQADLQYIDGYCDMYLDKSGYPIYVGDDQEGNQIYTLGLGRQMDVGWRSIHGFREVMGIPSQELQFVAVHIPGELAIWFAGKLAALPVVGYSLNRLLSDFIIKRNFNMLKDLCNNKVRH